MGAVNQSGRLSYCSSAVAPIQTGPHSALYPLGHPVRTSSERMAKARSKPLAHLPGTARQPRGSELCSAGSPYGTTLPVLQPGPWGQASSASSGLRTGHSWEWIQENRKGGSCWPRAGAGLSCSPSLHPRHPHISHRWQPCWLVTPPLQIRG